MDKLKQNDIISVVLLVTGIGLLFTDRYRLSIFFISTLILFRLLLEAFKQGIKNIDLNLSKTSLKADLYQRKEDLKEAVTEQITTSEKRQSTKPVQGTTSVNDRKAGGQQDLVNTVQLSIDEAYALGAIAGKHRYNK